MFSSRLRYFPAQSQISPYSLSWECSEEEVVDEIVDPDFTAQGETVGHLEPTTVRNSSYAEEDSSHQLLRHLDLQPLFEVIHGSLRHRLSQHVARAGQ